MNNEQTSKRPRNRLRSAEKFRPYTVVLGERHRLALENRADAEGVTLSEALRNLIEDHCLTTPELPANARAANGQ